VADVQLAQQHPVEQPAEIQPEVALVHAPSAVPQPRSRLDPRLQPLHHRVDAVARITEHRDAEPVPCGRGRLTCEVTAPAQTPPPAIHVPGQLTAEVPAPVPGLCQPRARRSPPPAMLVPAAAPREHRTRTTPAQPGTSFPQATIDPTSSSTGQRGMTPTNELKPHRYGSRTDRLTTAGDRPAPGATTACEHPQRSNQGEKAPAEYERLENVLTPFAG
jgi:hypothetical protein